MKGFKRIDILGCPFDAVSFDEAVDCIREHVLKGHRLQVVPGNIDFVMKARRDPVFRDQLWRADLIIADGVPVVWAASLLGTPLKGRVSGTDIVVSCAQVSEDTGCPVAMIGGMPGVAKRAADKMRETYPGANIFDIVTPFPIGDSENEILVQEIRKVNAQIVLVALGAPRQERWIQSNLEACGAAVGIGIGSAFDIIAGDQPRAPRWMKDNGLEWFHRLLLDPKRLGKRYLLEDSPFIFYFALSLLRKKLFSEN